MGGVADRTTLSRPRTRRREVQIPFKMTTTNELQQQAPRGVPTAVLDLGRFRSAYGWVGPATASALRLSTRKLPECDDILGCSAKNDVKRKAMLLWLPAEEKIPAGS
jgi:hypothetical protein